MSIENGKISLGGNVFVLGTKPDGSDWRVGIKDPRNESGLAAILSLRDAYAITSGGYERYFEENGKTYHHIIDPATGYPADSGLLSVTVVADANGPDQEWVQRRKRHYVRRFFHGVVRHGRGAGAGLLAKWRV